MGCVSSKGKKPGKDSKNGLLQGADDDRYQKISVLRGKSSNIPKKTFPQLLKELLKNKETHDRVALSFQAKETTFEQLDKQTEAFAKVLLKHVEVAKDKTSVVAILMPPSDKRVVTLLSAMKAHIAFLPLDPDIPNARMKFILTEGEVKTVIASKDNEEKAASLGDAYTILYFEDIVEEESDKTLPDDKNTDPLLAVYFTSGSTGVPKGVPIGTRALLNRLMWQWSEFPYDKDEVACHKTSLLFIDSLSELLAPLLKGVTVIIAPSGLAVDPDAFIDFVRDNKVSTLVLVPSLLRSVLTYLSVNEKGDTLPSLKSVISSGDELPTSVARDFFTTFSGQLNLINLYGSTETTGDATYELFTKESDVAEKTVDGHLSVGSPIWNTNVYIFDDEKKTVKSGTQGEIYISGMSVATRYVNGDNGGRIIENPDSKSNDDNVLFKTGDLGTMISDKIIFQGRDDSVVKISGQRFDLSELDRVVSEVDGLKACSTLGSFKLGDEVKVMTFYTTDNENVDTLEEAIREACTANLPNYVNPKLVKMDELPMQAATGKMDREELKRRYIDPSIGKVEESVDKVVTPLGETITKTIKSGEETVTETIKTGEQAVTKTVKKTEQTVTRTVKSGEKVVTETVETTKSSFGGLGGILGGGDSGGGGLGGLLGGDEEKKTESKESGGFLGGIGATVAKTALDQAIKHQDVIKEKIPILENIPLEPIFKIIAEKLGISPTQVKPDSNFFSLGGTSSSATDLVGTLRKKGLPAKIGDLLGSDTIMQFVTKLKASETKAAPSKYADHFEVWSVDENTDYDHLCEITARAYMKKNEVISAVVNEEALRNFFKSNEKTILDAGLSMYIVDKRSGKTVACSINYDLEHELTAGDGMEDLLDFMHEKGQLLVDYTQKKYGGRWFCSFSNVVDDGIDASHSLYLIELMERETVQLAENRGYDGIIANNMHETASVLSEQLGYQLFKQYKWNDGEVNGKKPWANLKKDYYLDCYYMPLFYDDEEQAGDKRAASPTNEDTRL